MAVIPSFGREGRPAPRAWSGAGAAVSQRKQRAERPRPADQRARLIGREELFADVPTYLALNESNSVRECLGRTSRLRSAKVCPPGNRKRSHKQPEIPPQDGPGFEHRLLRPDPFFPAPASLPASCMTGTPERSSARQPPRKAPLRGRRGRPPAAKLLHLISFYNTRLFFFFLACPRGARGDQPALYPIPIYFNGERSLCVGVPLPSNCHF